MRAGRLAALVSGALLLPACTSFADTVTAADVPAAAPSSADPADQACPRAPVAPDPDRPSVDLRFRLADDGGTVSGTETVVFTPDLDVDELVFRLVPNGPDSASAGSRLQVDDVRGSDVDEERYESAGAADPGGLYVVRLDRELRAGESTEVELDFTLSLGTGSFDRFGHDGGLSWWASGAPLLAWEPDVGWARDPFVDLAGETATSTVADTRVTVSAPQDLTVVMTGTPAVPSAPRDGRRTWTSREPVARDVGVAAGAFTVAEGTTPGGTRVRAAALPGGDRAAGALLDEAMGSIAALEAFLGPFPYETQTVALLPDYGGGIEYPGMIFEATASPQVLVHELAHMWFYGMVGNSQFRDPWLDEALASWAEAVVDSDRSLVNRDALTVDGPVGGSMADYSSQREYSRLVYDKGGAALLAARDAAGATLFDAAVRCYVNANAWTVATPADLAAVLADLPTATQVLVDAGALEPGDLPG